MTTGFAWRVSPPRLRGRWIGPAGVSTVVPQLGGLAALAAAIGPRGHAGQDGAAEPSATLVVEVDVAAGQPLAINRATGRLVAADALVYPRAVVIGLAQDATEAGFAVAAQAGGNVTLADWSAIAGTTALAAGTFYFLREGGGISPIVPTTVGSAIARIGEATSSTTLNLRLAAPILL